MAVYKSLVRCKCRRSQRRKVMWQSTPVLPVQHPATAKSYEPDDEKYFDKQQNVPVFVGNGGIIGCFVDLTRFFGRERLSPVCAWTTSHVLTPPTS